MDENNGRKVGGKRCGGDLAVRLVGAVDRPWCLPFILCLTALCGVWGCQQGMYDANALPMQLSAVPVVDVTSLDLSKLATPVYNPSEIQPGDVLQVTVASGIEQRPEHWELVVGDDGAIDVPLVGKVPVARSGVPDAQELVRQASIQRGLFRRPSVSVSMHERRTHRITVTGAVNDPGTYELPVAEAHLLSALVAAGGLSEDADTIVEVRHLGGPTPAAGGRGDPTIAAASFQAGSADATRPGFSRNQRIDLVSATTQIATGPGQFTLGDGTVVVVKQRPKRFVHVIGLVNRPNRFELPAGQNVTVLDAIAMAHGLSINIADKVIVLRNSEQTPQPVSIEVSLSEAKENPSANLLLADGDIVSVEETPTTIALGAVKQFVRVGLRATDFY